jgi:hypothetical protein
MKTKLGKLEKIGENMVRDYIFNLTKINLGQKRSKMVRKG